MDYISNNLSWSFKNVWVGALCIIFSELIVPFSVFIFWNISEWRVPNKKYMLGLSAYSQNGQGYPQMRIRWHEIEVEVYVATSIGLCHVEGRCFDSILDFGSICYYRTPSLLGWGTVENGILRDVVLISIRVLSVKSWRCLNRRAAMGEAKNFIGYWKSVCIQRQNKFWGKGPFFNHMLQTLISDSVISTSQDEGLFWRYWHI